MEKGVKSITVVTIMGAPEGVAKIMEQCPDCQIYTIAMGEKLNEKGFIVPGGPGDVGDRLFGTANW